MISSWFSEAVVHSIGWALVHSIWQIAIIGLISFILLRIFRFASAAFRYYLMVIGMSSCLVFAGTTLWKHWEQSTVEKKAALTINQKQLPDIGTKEDTIEVTLPLASGKSWTTIADFLQQHLSIVVLLWLFGVFLFSIRLIAAFAFLSHLRIWGTEPPPIDWKQRFDILVQKMRVQRPVEFTRSLLVREPSTFGHFKPIILFPAALLTQLDIPQVEALLLHELAHIKRRDFITNLLQSFLETLFFYHPGIWWLSRTIRELREECCDDLVLRCQVEPLRYAETLLAVQKNYLIQPKLQLAMKTSGNSTHLGARIRRLITGEQSLSYWRLRLSKVFLLLAVGLLFLTLGAFTGIMINQGPTISVAADKMNVFYMGIDNPITVAVAGVPSDKVKLNSEDVRLIDLGDGKYNVQPKQIGEATIKVIAEGTEPRDVTFRVKRIPDPVARVGKTTGGTYPAEQFKGAKSVNIFLSNFDFDVNCTVASFNIVRVGKNEDPVEVVNQGADFNEKTLRLVQKAAPGDFYYFDLVKGRCPGDLEPRKLNSLVYKLK